MIYSGKYKHRLYVNLTLTTNNTCGGRKVVENTPQKRFDHQHKAILLNLLQHAGGRVVDFLRHRVRVRV